jgi:uncharacterized protein
MDRDPDLLKNILLFSQILRKSRIGVTIDNVLDALKGISFIDIQERKDFYHLLKFNFVSRKEEMEVFDKLFGQFWSFGSNMEPSIKKQLDKKTNSFGEEEEISFFKNKKDQFLIKDWVDEVEKKGQIEPKDVPFYSPEEILRQKDFILLQKEDLEKVKEWVITLSKKLAMALSRRWRRGKRGNRLDFRRTFRQSVRYGGEIIELRMKQPKIKPLRVILVCDVSGSMDIYSHFFILFMYGIQNNYPNCDTFTFSTRLSCVTSLIKRTSLEEALRHLSGKVLDWSGGTNIGGALHQLHQHHSELLHPNRTVFFIFSDGWDLGDSALLDLEIKNLKKRVKKIIWLNPLLASPHYQPLCKGMSTVLPYLDYFLPLHNFSSLKSLSSFLLKM